MIVYVTQDGAIELTEKAYYVKEFRYLYKYYTENLKKPEKGITAFGILYYMYNYESPFLDEFENEKERMKAVKAYVSGGKDFGTTNAPFKAAVERYKTLIPTEDIYTYIVMRRNVVKLQEYANRMSLTPKVDSEDNVSALAIHVDYKEFTAVNTLLPKQRAALTEFRDKLSQTVVSSLDIYGGKQLGAYES